MQRDTYATVTMDCAVQRLSRCLLGRSDAERHVCYCDDGLCSATLVSVSVEKV